MAAKKELPTRPPRTHRDELQDLADRLGDPHTAYDIWNHHLTAKERRRAGKTLQAAFDKHRDAVGIWEKAKKVTRPRAIIELSALYGLPQAQQERLLREIGEKPKTALAGTDRDRSTSQSKPQWDRVRGVLDYENETVRKVRGVAVAKNIACILDAFQTDNWPPKIPNPLSPADDFQRLHQTLTQLNSGLSRIRFRAAEGCAFVYWVEA